MEQVIELLEDLISKHENCNLCNSWVDVKNEQNAKKAVILAFDYGCYKALTRLRDNLEIILYRETHK